MRKSRLNEIKDVITRSKESRLMTSKGKKKITLKNVEKLPESIISGKVNKKEARNSIADDVNKLNRLELTEPTRKMLPIFRQLEETFMGTKADDEVDDETDNKTDDKDYEDNEDDKKIDTADTPNLEGEESAEQKRKQEAKGLKILTPQQILTRLPTSLA